MKQGHVWAIAEGLVLPVTISADGEWIGLPNHYLVLAHKENLFDTEEEAQREFARRERLKGWIEGPPKESGTYWVCRKNDVALVELMNIKSLDGRNELIAFGIGDDQTQWLGRVRYHKPIPWPELPEESVV